MRGWFLVCEYWPPGNVEGEFKAEVQRQIHGRKHILGGVNGSGTARARWWVVGSGLVVAIAVAGWVV